MELTNNFWSVLQTGITMVGSVVIAYITYIWGKRRDRRRNPKDRIEVIFDGYGALIAQQRDELKRNAEVIDKLQALVTSQAQTLSDLRAQLDRSMAQNSTLQKQLENLKIAL